MAFVARSRFTWRLRSRSLPLGRHTLLMGILNVTPDSFSDGNRFYAQDSAVEHGLRLLDEGADIVDIGGESTRPNASTLPVEEELTRVLPVLKAILKARPKAILSVDTYHAETAARVIEAGVEIINDVSGLLWDPAMAGTLASREPGCVLMHTRGAPRMWNTLPPLPHSDVMPLVVSGLAHSLSLARAAGIERANMVLDPGFGFGKAGDENFVLLAEFGELQQFNLPLLAGVSRKRFLTAHLPNLSEAARLEATTAANVAAILTGAHVLRVHDIPAARAAASVADAMLTSLAANDEQSPSGIRRSGLA